MIGSLQSLKRKEEIIKNMNIRLSGKMIKRENIENVNEDEIYEYDEEESIVEELVDETFYYFENNLLSKSVLLSIDTKIDSFTIYLCIYQIKTDKEFPYLKYILKEDNNEYKFPEIKFTFSNLDDIEIYFKNEVIKNVMSIVNLYDKIDGNFVNKIYKGFIEDESDIFVFIDVSEFNPKISKEYIFSIMDEIINIKKINDKNINNKVTDIFFKNRFITYLKYTSTNKNIQYPIIGYNCIFNENTQTYENVLDNDNDSDDNDNNEFYMIDHHLFGNKYYFTSESVEKQTSFFNLKKEIIPERNKKLLRYAIFIENPKYILRDIGNDNNVTQSRKYSDVNNETYIYNITETENDSSSLYFHENNIQFWGIKNINSIAII